MKKTVRIKGFSAPNEGVSKKTEKAYAMTDLAVEWDELDVKGQQYTQSMVITLSGYINEPVVQAFIDSKQYTEITYYMEADQWNNKWYNRIKGYINKDFLASVKTPLTF